MSFLLSLLFIAVVLVVLCVRGSRKKTELSAASWDQLVARLEPVPADVISKVALDYLQPRKGQVSIQTDEMWFLLGGNEGIRRMQANADVLIALAGFAQQWNLQESAIVVERMRRDGLALRRSSRDRYLALLLGYGRSKASFSVQEVASSYYLMRQQLLALYKTSHASRYPRLAVALGHSAAACGLAI
jgi:hypothetical protein